MQERGAVLTALTGRAGARRWSGRPALVVVVALLVVAADQLTKTLAVDHLAAYRPRHLAGPLFLDLTFNPGAAFSLGRGVTPVVESVVVVLVAGLLLFGRRAARTATLPVAAGLGLLLGGAAGNLVDRLLRHNRGAVIDFIDMLRVGHRDLWPIFNVADASIVVGAAILALAYSRRGKDATSA